MGFRWRVRNLQGAALLLGLIAARSGAAEAADRWSGRGWLTVAGGQESDLTLDSSPTPAIVPGGLFVSLIGGLSGRTGSLRRTHLELGAQGWYERFTETEGRTLVSATAAADLNLALAGDWALRFGAGGHFFDDSAQVSSRRGAGWGEVGLVFMPGPWSLEVQGGAEERRYPNLLAPDDTGTIGTYSETRTNAGAHVDVRATRAVLLRAAWHARRTDARDPFYDSEEPTVEAGADILLGRRVSLLLDGFLQERTFTARPAGLDKDRYGLVGAGIVVAPGWRWRVRANAVFSRYTWPDGTVTDTHRYQLALTALFGSPGWTGLPAPEQLLWYEIDEVPDVPRAGRAILFRVHAPQAQAVVLVGDFNGWDPGSDRLQPVGDGWWEVSRALPAGTWAYAYVVDGVWRTPPEAGTTEPDGFGGRNGLIVVYP